jgi:glutaredoxin-related protein
MSMELQFMIAIDADFDTINKTTDIVNIKNFIRI